MAQKRLQQVVRDIGREKKIPCVPERGKWNSCEPCRDCNKRANIPPSGGTPLRFGSELREDGSNELREDGGIELREN